MRVEKFFICLFLVLFFSIAACQDEKGKGDYSGVSELISNRNKARYEAAENAPEKSDSSKKSSADKPSSLNAKSNAKKDALSTIILYEEAVEIRGTNSGKTLAKGVAYINKSGQIVRIKILKE